MPPGWVVMDVYMRQLIHASFFRFSPDAEQIIQGMQRIMQKQPPGHYRHLVDRCISAMLEEPIFAELRQIHQAALILFGEEDALIPNKLLHQTSTARIAATGAAEMSHASLHMIPQAGHFVQWEAAETVNAYIGHWLRAAADGH